MRWFVPIFFGLVVLVSGCVGQTAEVQTGEVENIGSDAADVAIDAPTQQEEESQETSGLGWRDIQVTEVETGETFKISDFTGQKVVLESMAVWCPVCTSQQREIGNLIAAGDTSIHISLDTDPNEDDTLLLDHKKSNGFTWNYAVAPAEMSQSLVDEFGFRVVSAPTAPVILVCEDQSARLLGRGVKSASKLVEEIVAGC